jgi:hypothetical protein
MTTTPTTTTSPTSELREAARLMRERAEKATPGPWFVTSEAAQYGGLVAAPTEGFPYDAGYAGHLIGESMSDGNREYVASMHPAVALPLADLLDSLADMYEQRGMEPMPLPLAIARAYLGTAAAAVAR